METELHPSLIHWMSQHSKYPNTFHVDILSWHNGDSNKRKKSEHSWEVAIRDSWINSIEKKHWSDQVIKIGVLRRQLELHRHYFRMTLFQYTLFHTTNMIWWVLFNWYNCINRVFQLLKPNSVHCRRVDELVKDDKKQLTTLVDSEHKDLFAFLSKKTGWNLDGSRISDVFNVLHRKYSNGVPQPDWVNLVLSNVTELKRQFRSIEFNSDEKSKMRTGYLLGQVTKDMNEQKESGRKLIVYATHDATVTSMMYSLGISDHQLVPYTAALIVELHSINQRKYVKVCPKVRILINCLSFPDSLP